MTTNETLGAPADGGGVPFVDGLRGVASFTAGLAGGLLLMICSALLTWPLRGTGRVEGRDWAGRPMYANDPIVNGLAALLVWVAGWWLAYQVRERPHGRALAAGLALSSTTLGLLVALAK